MCDSCIWGRGSAAIIGLLQRNYKVNDGMIGKSVCLTDLDYSQVEQLMAEMGEPVYRARQLQNWIYKQLAGTFADMTNLPGAFRRKLIEKARLHSLEPVREMVSKDGTVKALFTLADNRTVESSLMMHHVSAGKPYYTVCASTQIGCTIGCPFCATGQQGFERNLTSGEIIDQVLYFASRLRAAGAVTNHHDLPVCMVNNVVFMGMGEPLANYDAVLKAIKVLNSNDCLGIGARNMTVSTAGLVPQIKRFASEELQVRLAVSLHAGDNVLRNRLVPLNKRYPLEKLMKACSEYCNVTGRRISFEYILFEGINDSFKQARQLASILEGIDCHVNLITASATANEEFRAPARATVLAFRNELRRLRVNCTVRQRKGNDIDAGCGQLRSRFIDHRGA